VPWVAPEQGASLQVQRCSLLSPEHCRKHVKTAKDKFRNSKTCEQGMQHLFIDVRGLKHLLKDKTGAGV
jgi:hypothetical protein